MSLFLLLLFIYFNERKCILKEKNYSLLKIGVDDFKRAMPYYKLPACDIESSLHYNN